MEANSADWDTLFETYPFFEAHKNYLWIDISAENADDLRNWKGWVKSRMRQLILKVCTSSFIICSFIYFSFSPVLIFIIFSEKELEGDNMFFPLLYLYITQFGCPLNI
jgi:poly(A) polymerase Pap1